ncbi:hypothetical protein HMSSN139_37060 [Paenibacillus sp. HMSSN-139]|nr:hypothetical protein HMSSN139_37060 [Paenibacillus sp. HMSSN-139]
MIVHLPMEPKQGRPEWLGPGAILSSMTDEEIRRKVEAAVDQVPYAVGMNNHMGSKVTGDERVMSVILEVCRERGLFFVDSKTNYWSVIPRLSEEKGLPRLENDIFLDDVGSEEHVTGQLRQVLELLKKNKTRQLRHHWACGRARQDNGGGLEKKHPDPASRRRELHRDQRFGAGTNQSRHSAGTGVYITVKYSAMPRYNASAILC